MKPTKKMINLATKVAMNAGERLIDYQNQIDQLKVTHKEAQGVVSSADVDSESFIIESIKKSFPEHCFLGEESAFESYGSDQSKFKSYQREEWLWVIDPLDGTNNFLNGMDYFAVSIALLHKGKTILGVTYRPITGELFLSIEGEGAFYRKSKNARKKKVYNNSTKRKLHESIILTGFGFSDEDVRILKKSAKTTRGFRKLGSASLDICYVGLGVWNGFFSRNLPPWDTSAAFHFASLAGARVTDYNGRKYHSFRNSILCARGVVHKEMKEIIQSCISD